MNVRDIYVINTYMLCWIGFNTIVAPGIDFPFRIVIYWYMSHHTPTLCYPVLQAHARTTRRTRVSIYIYIYIDIASFLPSDIHRNSIELILSIDTQTTYTIVSREAMYVTSLNAIVCEWLFGKANTKIVYSKMSYSALNK